MILKRNSNLVKIILTLLLVSALLMTPYAVEKIILFLSGDNFNTRIMLPKEAWFGFIASYIGAIGTVTLGIIAIWQNKRYKKLSDDSSKEVMEIQGELRNLNKRIVDAIETLENIEVAIYTPAIQHIHSSFYNESKETLDERTGICAYQINRINIFDDDLFITLEELMEKYRTFAFTIRNIGEKPIRNFSCFDIKVNNTTQNSMFSSTDIMSGEITSIVFSNLQLEVGDTNLDLYFEFDTLLLEKYCFNVNVIVSLDGVSFNSYFTNFEEPRKIEDSQITI